jgi:uncharacterized protein (TIGR02996 family)
MPAKPKSAFPNPAAVLPGEADILAKVIANLSDHTAKLIYADWLEERDDPRGPFLRQFVTAHQGRGSLPPLKTAPKVWRDLIGLTLTVELQHSPLVMRESKILSLARLAIRFGATRAAEKTIPLGASKLGGGPDLPPDAEWPCLGEEPLAFFGQFNLAELHASPVAYDLPSTGLFSVFALYDEDEGNDDFPKGSWRLLYFPDAEKLTRHLPPETSFRPCRVTFRERLTLPYNGPPWGGELGVGPKHLGHDAYWMLHLNMCPGDHFLGHPFPILSDVLGKKTVRHLLTIGGNDAAGWEWGDGGALYFTINEADLQNQKFDRVRMEMQCA